MIISRIILTSTFYLAINLAYGQSYKTKDYLKYSQEFANTLMKNGVDNFGSKSTPMWASVIDTRDLTIPQDGVPPTEGVRVHDRAVGGSNLLHDVYTLRLFDVLSDVTGDRKYTKASESYLRAYLDNCQNVETGLLGWGEHLFYDFYEDQVSPAGRYKERGDFSHEYLASTPPLVQLWELDPDRTAKAIEGLRLHFINPDSITWLFNRHAYWNKNEHQTTVMPWIKHSALYTYSFFLHASKTNDLQVLKKGRGVGNLYWSQRNPDTDLTMSCLYHKTEPGAGKNPGLNGMSYLSYWTYKAWEFLPEESQIRERALTMFDSILKHSWDPTGENYFNTLNFDGTPMLAFDESGPGPTYKYAAVYPVGYGTYSIMHTGRIAAYLAEREDNDFYRETVLRIARITNNTPLPEVFTAEHLANAIHLNLDAYEISGDKTYLDEAREFADLAIAELHSNGLFVREKGDPYYEAKLDTGSMVYGILRLYLTMNSESTSEYDWSI